MFWLFTVSLKVFSPLVNQHLIILFLLNLLKKISLSKIVKQEERVVATGRFDEGLYMLECINSTFVSVIKNKNLYASYDLWYARLSHVNYSVIFLLNKKCILSLTSLLPSPSFSTCQLAKNHHLPYP